MDINHLPLWAVFGVLAACLSSAQMLLQEHFKAAAFPMAFWNKVACIIAMAPFVAIYGLPTNIPFYLLIAAQSLLWVVSDVIFYRGVSEVGAGMIARIMPLATIASFVLWFAVDWPLASAYAAQPLHSLLIFIVFAVSAFCASRIKACHVTWPAIKRVWFVLFAAVLGTLMMKYTTRQVDIEHGTYSFVFAQAWMMIVMWLIYYAIKRPLPLHEMFGLRAIKSGLTVGAVSSFAVLTTVYAIYHIDNPAYVSSVKYLDSVLILLFYRVAGRPVHGNVWAGLGLVICAAVLVILKSHA